jgi:hypothetical protein
MHRSSVKLVSKPVCALVCAVGMAYAGSAGAGVTIKGPGDTSFSIGAGVRISYTTGDDADQDFELENTRIFTSGQITKNLSGVLNFEKEDADDESLAILDAIVRYSFSPAVNVWVGRQIPAVDRANLAGPFYATGWSYPGVVSGNPSIDVGRDNGVQVWGNIGKFKYVVGLFEGHNNFEDTGGTDSLAYTGRFLYSFIGSEAGPVYYENATYHGAADLLSLAFGFQYQNDGVGTAAEQDDYLSWNIDVLYESKLGPSGSLTLEAAYYSYDFDVLDCGMAGGVSASCAESGDNIGGLDAPGDGYLLSAAYLFPQVIGIGQLQPYVRYQHRSYDELPPGSEDDLERWDIGLNYIIKGHDARLTATYSSLDGAVDDSFFLLGVQFQY